MDAKAKVVGRKDGVAGVDRMFDSQWVNVVNHDNCYRGWDENDAIAHAVRMTEQYMAANHKQATQALLTGLEALATKWAALSDKNWTDYEKTRHKHEPDFEAQGKANVFADCCEELRTLTNPANSENHEVLK